MSFLQNVLHVLGKGAAKEASDSLLEIINEYNLPPTMPPIITKNGIPKKPNEKVFNDSLTEYLRKNKNGQTIDPNW